MSGIFHLLDQAVIGRDVTEVAAPKQVEAAVSRVRPVGQLVIAIDKQADQRRTHPAVVAFLLLLLANRPVGAIDVLADLLRVEMLVTIKLLDNGVARQLCGKVAAGETGDAVTDHKAGGSLAHDVARLILIALAGSLVRH